MFSLISVFFSFFFFRNLKKDHCETVALGVIGFIETLHIYKLQQGQ